MSTDTEAYSTVRKLRKATSKDEVAEIMTGVSVGAFIMIDETPGLFDPNPYDGDWFAWLRQLRNDPAAGLFERLT